MSNSRKCLLCKQMTGPDHHSGCDRFDNPMCAWFSPIKKNEQKRDKENVRCDLILAIMKMKEVLDEHKYPDELAGYHYVVPVEKLDLLLDQMRRLSNEINSEMPTILQNRAMFDMQSTMNESFKKEVK